MNKLQKEKNKLYKVILVALSAKKVIKKFGLVNVKWAMSRFITETTEQQKIEREQKELEKRLAEIKKKSAL